MTTTTTETTHRSYCCVGTVGRAVFVAGFAHEGNPVLFSGVIRVHRIGGIEDPDRQFRFECLPDLGAARWYDADGHSTDPVAGDGIGLATDADYYGVILPAIRRLEQSVSAGADSSNLELVRVGLVECWQYRNPPSPVAWGY